MLSSCSKLCCCRNNGTLYRYLGYWPGWYHGTCGFTGKEKTEKVKEGQESLSRADYWLLELKDNEVMLAITNGNNQTIYGSFEMFINLEFMD